MKITVTNHVTLDGVMQAPAGADEDRAGGFKHGGWAADDNDAVMGEEMARGMARRGDAAEAGARMKAKGGPDLAVLGSGDLIESLMRRNLVDEFLVMIHPVVLGKGKRLFRGGGPYASLRLVDSKVTTKGVVMATYRLGEKR